MPMLAECMHATCGHAPITLGRVCACRLLFFTKGKPDGMPCLGVRCRRHAHQGMEQGHLVLLDRMQDVMRWFVAHADCR